MVFGDNCGFYIRVLDTIMLLLGVPYSTDQITYKPTLQ